MEAKRKDKPREWLTSAEAAELIGIDDVTLRNWRSRGRENSPPFYKPGGAIRYDRAEVIEWIESNRVAH